jgi:D-alanyl-D-alanine carboxypeptidase/Putative peptidoglycan binding domain
MQQLSGSVGLKGKNNPQDVTMVQQLLLAHGFRIGEADGNCGDPTIQALLSFQRGFLRVPDGRVDPGGRTWRHLLRIQSSPAVQHGSQFTRLVPRPARETFNVGLVAATTAFMKQTLGSPRETFSNDCQAVTEPTLKRNMITGQVGSFRVSGLAPAINALKDVFSDIASKQPDVYSLLGTAGMLCCRYVRGSITAISNHSWGTAIDLTIDGALDQRGDGRVQYGLTLIAPIFNEHGWYWGAGFPTEDGMHFEGSRKLINDWKAQLK